MAKVMKLGSRFERDKLYVGWGSVVSSRLKRTFDIVMSLALMVLFFPVLLVIAASIKVTSPGPLIFRQKRLGKDGKIFLMNKFRKFPADLGSKGPSVTLQFDTRMTKIGQILERTKLDEIPQLWNILIGEMSFVGPRPETTNFAYLFVGDMKRILGYKPGIFGPNQAKYRNESAMYPENSDPEEYYTRVLFPDKAKRDLAYFEKANFLSDLWWIVSGVFTLVFSVVILRRSSKSSILLCVMDIAAVLFGWMLAHYLKYGPSIVRDLDQALYSLGFVVIPAISFVTFFVSRIYRNPPRYFSETDFYRLIGSTCFAWIGAAIVLGVLLKSTSSLLLAVSCVTSIFTMTAPRVIYRRYRKNQVSRRMKKSRPTATNVVVCGITDQSVELCRLLTLGFPRANVLGLVAGDRELVRREIYGFEILGNYTDLDMLHARYEINHVWIASDIDDPSRMLIIRCCNKIGMNVVDVSREQPFRALLSDTPDSSPAGRTKTKRTNKEAGQVKAEGPEAVAL